MSIVSAAVDAIFAHPAMATEAVWWPLDGGGSRSVRLIRKMPDEVLDYGQAQIAAETVVADVRVSEIAGPRQGDRLSIGGEDFEVIGDPRKDREGLVWTMDLTRA